MSTANKNSYAKREMRLSTYVNTVVSMPVTVAMLGNETWYHFGDNKHLEWEDVFGHYVRPRHYRFGPYESLSFGLGASGSGVPFHTHGHVFAEVFYGRKRWWLVPPTAPNPRFDGDESTLSWLVKVYPTWNRTERAALMECVCEVGDLLYIPGLWWHATLNIGETVFMSVFV